LAEENARLAANKSSSRAAELAASSRGTSPRGRTSGAISPAESEVPLYRPPSEFDIRKRASARGAAGAHLAEEVEVGKADPLLRASIVRKHPSSGPVDALRGGYTPRTERRRYLRPDLPADDLNDWVDIASGDGNRSATPSHAMPADPTLDDVSFPGFRTHHLPGKQVLRTVVSRVEPHLDDSVLDFKGRSDLATIAPIDTEPDFAHIERTVAEEMESLFAELLMDRGRDPLGRDPALTAASGPQPGEGITLDLWQSAPPRGHRTKTDVKSFEQFVSTVATDYMRKIFASHAFVPPPPLTPRLDDDADELVTSTQEALVCICLLDTSHAILPHCMVLTF
jgi:hypothetical protein